MMTEFLREPNTGARLRPIVLQVISSDEYGPIDLKYMHDKERMDLANTPPQERKFVIAWCSDKMWLGEHSLSDLYANAVDLKIATENHEETLRDLKHRLAALASDVELLEADNKLKTEELRRLQRERDPERFEKAIKEAVAVATAEHEKAIAFYMTERAELLRELEEVRASKKRLKEANERLKDGRR